MKLIRRILVLALALAPAAALAQTVAFPTKPLRLIVPFPAGGPADLFGRLLAQHMGDKLGQPVIVENVGGVGGVLGVDRAAKAAPDGYTLVLNSSSTVAIAPFSMAKMPYDVKKDLAYITSVVLVPEVLAVNPSLPVNSLKELVDYARANPGKVNFGSAGGGTVTHLAGELLKVEAKVNIVHVPYKGAAPAVTDMLSGQVQMGVFDVPVLIGHIRAGKLKPLALTSAKRTPLLPDVPTVGELGYPKVISDNWYGLVGAAAIPPQVQKRIHAAAIAALRVPSLVEAYGKVAGIPVPSSPEEYQVFVAAEQAKWSKVVAAIGFKQQ
jgi:tripartite-type tricarboxylate transporter receptor subunit TctC